MTDILRLPQSRAHPRTSLRGRLLALAASLACLGGVSFLIDLPVARSVRAAPLRGDLRRLADFPEVAAHGLGVACLIVAVAALDPTLWRKGPGSGWLPKPDLIRFLGATYAGSWIVNAIKISIVRVRPRAIDLAGLDSVADTFGPAAAAASHATGSDLMSFASGHSAVAAGFAAALSSRYPHATWFFVAVAIAAMSQRITSSAHYPSDVFCGAALGLLGAAVCLGSWSRFPDSTHR